MKRRGYIISTVLLVVDLLFFAFGGAFIALAAIVYALGIGEYIARVKYRAIPCDPSFWELSMRNWIIVTRELGRKSQLRATTFLII